MNNQPRTQQQFAEPAQHADEIDLKHLFLVLMRRKWQIVMFTIVVGFFASIYAFSIMPTYQANAVFLLEADNGQVSKLEDVYNDTYRMQDYYYTQLEIMQSSAVAKRVVENLQLHKSPLFTIDKSEYLQENPQFLSLNPEQLDKEIAQAQFQSAQSFVSGGLSIGGIKDTYLVNISFASAYPEMSAFIANAVGPAYVANHMTLNLQRIEKSAEWLNASMAGLKAKLEVSENKLQSFEESELLIDIGGIKGLAVNEVKNLTVDQTEARQLVKQTGLIYQLVQNKNNNITELAALPEILNHPNIEKANITKQKTEDAVAELSLTYGPKHPKMVAAKAELGRAQRQVNRQIQQLLSNIGNDYKKAQASLKEIGNALVVAKQKYQQLTLTENKHLILEQEVLTNKNLYETFFTKLNETSQLQGFEGTVGRIIEEAYVPRAPSKPNKRLIVVLAMLLAGMCSAGAVLLLEAINSTVRSVDDVENKLHQNLLGIVPLIPEPQKKGKNQPNVLSLEQYFNLDEHSFGEAIRTLRTSLLLLNIEDNAKVISITSSVPGEGKTTVSSNLAFALGQLNKTIIIDTDMRRPSIAKNFNIDKKAPGLSNLIAGINTLDECIHHHQKSGIDVICAGDIPPNPQELLASNNFKQLIIKLRQQYDRVLIDTAPIQAVSDSMIVARLADAVMFVVLADSTKQSMIKSSLKRLSLAGIKIDGLVLNQVDISKVHEYEGFNGYYDSYSYNT